jgi:hypothetical protein
MLANQSYTRGKIKRAVWTGTSEAQEITLFRDMEVGGRNCYITGTIPITVNI